jgi:hypothetical protein
MFANMMDSVMEEVVGYLFRLQVKVTPGGAQPAPAMAPPTAKGRKTKVKKGAVPVTSDQTVTTASSVSPGATTSAPQLSPLAAEAAAARSELKLTAAGLPQPAVVAPVAPVAQPAAKTDPAVLRTNRPGAAGRRNQAKKKRR